MSFSTLLFSGNCFGGSVPYSHSATFKGSVTFSFLLFNCLLCIRWKSLTACWTRTDHPTRTGMHPLFGLCNIGTHKLFNAWGVVVIQYFVVQREIPINLQNIVAFRFSGSSLSQLLILSSSRVLLLSPVLFFPRFIYLYPLGSRTLLLSVLEICYLLRILKFWYLHSF